VRRILPRSTPRMPFCSLARVTSSKPIAVCVPCLVFSHTAIRLLAWTSRDSPSDAYEMKAVADSGTEPESGTSASESAEAIEAARQFVETIATILGPEGPTAP
jgi:hypothetical protein